MQRLRWLSCLLFLASPALAADPLVPDKNLDAAIKAALPHHKGDLTEQALGNLYVLDAGNKAIESLTGLEKCPNLAELRLGNNKVADLKPLAGLKNLQSLTLSRNQIADLAPLAELTRLQYLELSDNQAADLAPLAKLTNLSALYLSGNQVSDLGPLTGLTRLSSLSLGRNKIKDLAPLAKLTRVMTLDLQENQIADLAPLASLNELSLLILSKNQITDLTPLVTACKADAAGPKRFAPYLRLYLADNPLSDAAKKEHLEELRKAGVRLADTPAGRAASPSAAGPLLALHPKNPHYFLFRGKPTVLITSGEHYGAVLNLDFDYVPYLTELQAHGLNLTRTFAGTYREVPGSFNIIENTLAPKSGRFACPWVHSATPGAGDGGNKFDLTSYDPAYFERLKDFVAQAGKRGVVVELVLFCTVYDDKLWAVNPMNAANNVQGVGKVSRTEVYSAKDKALLAAQEALVRKIVAELKDFDNVYYEICNEPYTRPGFAKEWNDHIIAAIVDAEKDFPARHLIAQNISNNVQRITDPNPHVSIFNFHYAVPSATMAQNYGLNKALADDETGFRGKEDRPYRTEGWDFLMAGGAVFSNLDYSFTPSKPDGSFVVTTSPGGGGPELRRQLAILKRFIEGFDFVAMKPANAVVKGGRTAGTLEGRPGDAKEARVTVRVLAEAGKAYALYVHGGTQAELDLELPAGAYRAEWVNPKTGQVDKAGDIDHRGGAVRISSPEYAEDIALRIKRAEGGRQP